MLSFGIAYGSALLTESDKTLARSLDDAVAVGAKWVRTDLPWDLVQPSGPYQYDWQSVDRIVDAANARGLKVLPILDDPPHWARQSVCKTQVDCPPADNSTYAHFASVASARYAPQGVHAWEIWNEPNIGVWLPKPDPAAYEKLLAATSTALRKADRAAYIVLGGLAAVPTQPSAKYISAFDFLTAVARLGGTRYVNAVGYHPYSLPTLPSVAANFQAISSSRDNLVAVLQKYGTPEVSVWLTETGAQVNEKKVGVAADPLQLQATYATDLVQTVATNRYVGADFWYSDRDFPGLLYGLRAGDGTQRPAFNALKAAIASCGCDSKK
ncbi:MAG: cellulase family glycosylhydrolase [Actinocrinis sp.]